MICIVRDLGSMRPVSTDSKCFPLSNIESLQVPIPCSFSGGHRWEGQGGRSNARRNQFAKPKADPLYGGQLSARCAICRESFESERTHPSSAAAGASPSNGESSEAPSGQSAPVVASDTDTSTSTPPA